MVTDALNIEKAGNKFIDFAGDAVLVAHNAEFDYGFLQADFPDTDFAVLDTLALSRVLMNDLKNYRLDTIAKKCDVNLENHHRAVADAQATANIFLKFVDMLYNEGIKKLNEIN